MTITARNFLARAVGSIALCSVCSTLAGAQAIETRLLKRQKVAAVEPAPLEISNLRAGGAGDKFLQDCVSAARHRVAVAEGR